ncbi:MAG TPA: lipopolysaccharide kinase InaA family protein [Labilithrix sp.]|nr:lipopolysaccharide kinase InaA family protein [Labilithrix sp.]
MGDRPEPPSYLLEARYLAETHVARGETADVFSGSDTYSGEHVAVRRLRPDRLDRAAAFRRMSERLFGTTSARLLRAIAMGEDREGLPLLVTELLVGRDVQRLGQVRWEVACEVTRQCAAAVAEMHLHGLHHGDLRPSTFFVGASTAGGSRVKLLDLGTGDRTATATKDVRALVGILHRLLLGRPPLPAKVRSTLKLNVTGTPPALEQSLGRWLDTDGEGFTAEDMATELLEIRNASHGEFWSGAKAQPQPPSAGRVSVAPRSSMIFLEGSEDDDDDQGS